MYSTYVREKPVEDQTQKNDVNRVVNEFEKNKSKWSSNSVNKNKERVSQDKTQEEDSAKPSTFKLQKSKALILGKKKTKKGDADGATEATNDDDELKNRMSLSVLKAPQEKLESKTIYTNTFTCAPTIFGDASTEPPKVHLKVVQVSLEAGKPLDLVLSANLVIRTVNKYSIAFFSVIVGDQILKVNDIVPMSVSEFLSIMRGEQSMLKLSILRAWNIQPSTEPRMAWVKRQDNYSYFIAEVYQIKNLRNGFDVKFINKQCYVTKVECNSRGAYVFLLGDRLLDVDSIPITASTDLKFVRRQFNKVMMKEGKCTFLVERQNSLRSSPNPSCFAQPLNPDDIEMGSDVVEIGCRESMRHQLLHDKYRPVSIVEQHGPKVEIKSCDEDEAPKYNKRSKRLARRRSLNNRVAIDTRTETLRMPSDVKNEALLQKVTPRSGLINFVRNAISR